MRRTDSSGSRRRRTLLKIALGVPGVIVLALVLALVIVRAAPNLVRGPLSRYLSASLGRHVALNGDVKLHLFPRPAAEIDGIVIDNVPGGDAPHLAEVQALRLVVSESSLLRGRFVLRDCALIRPRLWLEKKGVGRVNWVLGHRRQRARSPGLPVRHLGIEDGTISYVDHSVDGHVTIKLNSPPQKAGSTESDISFQGEGTVHGGKLELDGHAAAAYPLTEQGRPFKVSFTLRAPDGAFTFDGTFVPPKIERIEGNISLQGQDLSHLYPALPIPLPWTPPYRVSGHLVRDVDRWDLDEIQGRLGESDVEGKLSLDMPDSRPALRGNLVSRTVRFDDLGGFVGLPPGKQAPSQRPPEQRRVAKQHEASPKALPQKTYDLNRLRSTEADIDFTGQHVIAPHLPLDNVRAVLHLHGGHLAFQPLDFGLAGGHVRSNLSADATASPMRSHAEVTLENLDIGRLYPKVAASEGSNAGKLGGVARLDATGDSVAQLLGSATGGLGVIMWGGRANTLALVLTNLDLARAGGLVLSGKKTSQIRCVVGSFTDKDGVLSANRAVIDTTAVKINLSGSVDFRDEQYKLRLQPQEKQASPIALRGPLEISGTFRHPSVTPAYGRIAARVGAAAALGILFPPAALLPLIDFGGAGDANCRALAQMATSKAEQAGKGEH